MARAGLGDGWRCSFANDFDAMKAATYRANWGGDHLACCDVAKIAVRDLPGIADLAWASFPCQDLSLAGDGAGLGDAGSATATRSGVFWRFWSLMRSLADEGRAPKTVVLENVCGMLTSHAGRDFEAICAALREAGYRFGAVVMDAVHFLPQSRRRVFIIAVRADLVLPPAAVTEFPAGQWYPSALVAAYLKLSQACRDNWVWWDVPKPPPRATVLSDYIEDEPLQVEWHTAEQTNRLLGMMSPVNSAKIEVARAAGKRVVGSVYKRTRLAENGGKIQRAEVRFDNVSGCLRTPGGGSSRQTIIAVHGDRIRSRLLSPREAARLMGLGPDYELPARYNDAYRVAGDGVCVPVVKHLAHWLLEPLLAANRSRPVALAAE